MVFYMGRVAIITSDTVIYTSSRILILKSSDKEPLELFVLFLASPELSPHQISSCSLRSLVSLWPHKARLSRRTSLSLWTKLSVGSLQTRLSLRASLPVPTTESLLTFWTNLPGSSSTAAWTLCMQIRKQVGVVSWNHSSVHSQLFQEVLFGRSAPLDLWFPAENSKNC